MNVRLAERSTMNTVSSYVRLSNKLSYYLFYPHTVDHFQTMNNTVSKTANNYCLTSNKNLHLKRKHLS